MINFLYGLLTIAVLVFVLGYQYRNWQKSKKSLANIDAILNKKKLFTRLDWKANLEILDRHVAPSLDDIRRFSNAALVTGIGGTMGIFFSEALYLMDIGVSDLEIKKILQGAIPALLSSLAGIFFHLLILSKHLADAQERLVKVEMELLDAEDLPQHDGPVVNIDVSSAVNKIFQEIADTQKGVSESAQEIKGLLQEHKETSLIQRDSAKEIQEGIQSFVDQLKSFPDDLKNSLKVTEFQRLLKEQQDNVSIILSDVKESTKQLVEFQEDFSLLGDKFLESIKQNLIEHQQLSREIHDNVQNLTKQMETLPGDIRNSLEISEFFDKAARGHLAQLHEVFKDHQKNLEEQIIDNQKNLRSWLATQMYHIVKGVIGNLQQTIKTVTDPLDEMSKKLSAATKEMPDAANKFGTDLIKSADTLASIPEDLKKVSESVNDVVRATADAALKPLSDDMKDFLGTVQDTHQRLENTIHGLVHLIEKIIMKMEVGSK